MTSDFSFSRLRDHEALWQVLFLVFAIAVVHATYSWAVRPAAQQQQQRIAELGTEEAEERATLSARAAVVIKDYEQEACFIALLWALAIMGMKVQKLRHARRLFTLPGRGGEESFLETRDSEVILPRTRDRTRFTDLRESMRARGYGSTVLYHAADACLDRFFTTHSVADATTAMKARCEMEAERQSAELSLVHYLTWAIPSIGFVGTVRGISAALGQADAATAGDLGPITESLGTAFNSTFVALLISLVIMLLLYKLQEAQEALVLDTQQHCQDHLLRYLRERMPADHDDA